jgi:hypothetical protein
MVNSNLDLPSSRETRGVLHHVESQSVPRNILLNDKAKMVNYSQTFAVPTWHNLMINILDMIEPHLRSMSST